MSNALWHLWRKITTEYLLNTRCSHWLFDFDTHYHAFSATRTTISVKINTNTTKIAKISDVTCAPDFGQWACLLLSYLIRKFPGGNYRLFFVNNGPILMIFFFPWQDQGYQYLTRKDSSDWFLSRTMAYGIHWNVSETWCKWKSQKNPESWHYQKLAFWAIKVALKTVFLGVEQMCLTT